MKQLQTTISENYVKDWGYIGIRSLSLKRITMDDKTRILTTIIKELCFNQNRNKDNYDDYFIIMNKLTN